MLLNHYLVTVGQSSWSTDKHDLTVSGLRQTYAQSNSSVTLRLGLSAPGLELFQQRGYTWPELVRIIHLSTSEVLWLGRVTSVRLTDTALEVEITSLAGTLDTPGGRPRYSRECRFSFGGESCGKTGPGIGGEAPVAGLPLNGTNVVPWSEASEKHRGGYLRDADGNSFNVVDVLDNPRRLVLDKVPTKALTQVRYGCGKTLSDCQAWDNVINFGGFPWVPDKNPMRGGGVF